MKTKNTILRAAMVAIVAMVLSPVAFAEGTAGASGGGLAFWGPALAIGLAVIGGGLGQGKAAAAALEGIARNPNAQKTVLTPMIIALALMESLVIFGFLIANGLKDKL